MSSGSEAQTAAPTPWQMSGALPPACRGMRSHPRLLPPHSCSALSAPTQPRSACPCAAEAGHRGRDTAGAGSPSPFSDIVAPPCRGWSHQTRSQGPRGGERYPTVGGVCVRLPRINVCRTRRAAAPTPASREPHRGSPHCAPWPAWGERLPQGSRILRPGSPSPTSQRSFETWISLEPLPPLSQGLPERKWGPLGPFAMAMLSP